MNEEEAPVPIVALTMVLATIVMMVVFFFFVAKKSKEEREKEIEETSATKPKPKQNQSQNGKQQANKTAKKPFTTKKKAHATYTHPWLLTTLKGHTSTILDMDFSQNGKYFITVAEDRSALIWSIKNFSHKEHRYIRAAIDVDHATRVRFSPDTKAFLVSLARKNILRVYRIGKKNDGSIGNFVAAFDFPQYNQADIRNIGVASNGRFIMVGYANTTILVVSIKGDILATIDTHQVTNSLALVSHCGRFIGSSGFTPDVKVWEVCFDKSLLFKEVSRAFELKGHSAGVKCFSFNMDSTRMASASKDGTWKLWDTDVQYKKQQDPYLLYTGTFHSNPSHIVMSPDSRTVVMSHGNKIVVFNTFSKKTEMMMENVHEGSVEGIRFDSNSKYFVSIGDRHVLIFNNITGYRAAIEELNDKLNQTNSNAVTERIKEQIQEANDALQEILPKSS
ncbi:transducin beta-like protein 2 [Octopus sinensis]|uniref:Transducin beta-like protein 2 n=1 Tax=Octopus sinensis TaxID=2607531 RepID=A0A6P7TQ23_9MOLL|nr:transducin beta-like protein 2 [Octopus sinensis]